MKAFKSQFQPGTSSARMIAVLFACASLSLAEAQLPLQPGDLVATYCPTMPGGIDPAKPCVMQVRNPTGGTLGSNWLAPLYWNASSPTDAWTPAHLGPVFGCCLDDAIPPNIYVTASTVYGNYPTSWGPGGSGGVYKIDGSTGSVAVMAMLPNAGGVGLGDISYDRHHKQFFVTNFEDGKIYRFKYNSTTQVFDELQAFDPWIPDAGTPGFAPLGERVWAVHMPEVPYWNGHALFFSAWLRDQGPQALGDSRETTPWPAAWPTPAPSTPNNTVFVVRVLSDGSIDTVQPPQVSLVMPPLLDPDGDPLTADTYSNPVSDIVYNNRRLILAERTMAGDVGQLNIGWNAHRARVLRYQVTNPATPVGAALFVGDYFGRANSAGGIALDTDNYVEQPALGNIWSTGDALHFGANDYIYGLQLLPDGGNGNCIPYSGCTYLIDLDHDTSGGDKSQPGDVEYYGGPHPTTSPADPIRFCSGDTYVHCPCGNYGDIGRGCANSVDPSGADLDLTGSPSLDDLSLVASGMPAAGTCVFLQGDQDTEIVFGDGVRCVDGVLIRLRVRTVTGGMSQFPTSSDTITLSLRGGVIPGSGEARTYQTVYRNAAGFCTPGTSNITNAWSVVW